MAFLFIVLLLLSMGFFFSIVFKSKFETVGAIPIFLIILVMYVFGIVGHLKWGIIPILIFSAFCFIFVIIQLIKWRSLFFKRYFTPGVLAFLVFCLIFLIGQKGRLLENFDEFSHWGLAVKNMYHYDALANMAEATTTFKGYPPATALLQYFFLQFTPTFSENYILMAMNVFAVLLLLPIFKKTEWKKPFFIIILFLLCLLLPTVFYPDFFVSLYVDGILGLLFAYILFTYFTSEKMDIVLYMKLSLAGCVLTLIKASGFGLVAIAFIIIFLDSVFFQRKKTSQYLFSKNVFKTVVKFFIMIGPIILSFVGKQSWDWYLKITNTPEAWETKKITLGGIKNLFLSSIPRTQLKGIQEFVRHFTEIIPRTNNSKKTASFLSYSFETSYVIWIVFFLLILFVIWHFCTDQSKERKRYKVLGFTLITGLFAYAASLLLLYLFTFAAWETESVAAFDRYMGTYMLGAFVFLVFLLIDHLPPLLTRFRISKSYVFTAVLCFVLCFANVYSIMNITVTSRFDVLRIRDIRNEYSNAADAYQIVAPEERVYIITQEKSSYSYNLCRYSLTPLKLNLNYSFSIMSDPDDSRGYAVRSTERWSDELKKDYDYLYVYRFDAGFVEDYGRLFSKREDIRNNTLYRVDKSAQLVQLIPIE